MAKMSLNLKQTQSLMMTPQLQQAIKLLTLTHLEMTNVIAKEMVENPVLEETGGEASREEVEKYENQTKEKKSDDFSGPDLVEKGKDDFDWDKYVENYNSTSSTPAVKEYKSKDDAPNYENMVSRGDTLQDHLEWQLRMENLTDEEWEFAEQVIYNIQDDGYLGVKLEDLLAKTKLDREDALELVKMIQHLDPVGCGSQDLKDCLLIQAQTLDEPVPLVELIIKEHLNLIMKQDYKGIAKELGIDEDRVKQAEAIIPQFSSKTR
jgi:RNA polymerase sigma-54 factor